MQKSGLAFHCHHDILVEYVYDYDERVRYIKENKPEDEQELRLRLFQMIPEDRVSQKAWEACYKAWEVYDKAWEVYDKANRLELEALHAELCPNCPWNGETIFAKEN